MEVERDSPPTIVKLVGIADYKPAGDNSLPDDFYCLIKLKNGYNDIYVNFNRAAGINQDSAEGLDKVLMVEAYDYPSPSELEAKLQEGDRNRKIRVGCVNTDDEPAVACVCINAPNMSTCKSDCSCTPPKVKREYIERDAQIQSFGSDLCWSLNAGSSENAEITLEKCDKENEYQRFHLENYATGKNGRPSWEDVRAQHGPFASHVGNAIVIRPKADPSMVVSVNTAKVKAWLRVKRIRDSNISYDENIFFDLPSGELVLGGSKCSYFGECLFAVSQGSMQPTPGTAVILRDGTSLYRESINRLGTPATGQGYVPGTPRGGIIAFWQPFGSL